MTTIDRADWHYGGEFPKDLPIEAGATHIGMFVAWAAARGLLSDEHRADNATELGQLTGREMTPGHYLRFCMDEKFWSSDLSPEGQAFVADYYRAARVGHTYYNDTEAFAASIGVPSTYYIPDSWDEFDRLAPTLDTRLADWRRKRDRQPHAMFRRMVASIKGPRTTSD